MFLTFLKKIKAFIFMVSTSLVNSRGHFEEFETYGCVPYKRFHILPIIITNENKLWTIKLV
jgi:hypothetical protein